MRVLSANIKEQLFVHTILTYFAILLPVNMKFYKNSKKKTNIGYVFVAHRKSPQFPHGVYDKF